MKIAAVAGFALLILSAIALFLMMGLWRQSLPTEIGKKAVGAPGSPGPATPPTPVLNEATDVEADDSPKTRGSTADMKALRRAVRSGNHYDVGWVKGMVAPDDAADFYDLIAEIPEGIAPEDREKIISKLVEKLQDSPSDETSRVLLNLAQREEVLSTLDWVRTVSELGRRKFSEALPYLEIVAFTETDIDALLNGGGRGRFAASALLTADMETYLPSVLHQVITSTGSTFGAYVGSLSPAAESAHPKIGELIPWLVDRYDALGKQEWSIRFNILSVVAEYGISANSDALRDWALREVKTRPLPADEKTAKLLDYLYEDILEALEKPRAD